MSGGGGCGAVRLCEGLGEEWREGDEDREHSATMERQGEE